MNAGNQLFGRHSAVLRSRVNTQILLPWVRSRPLIRFIPYSESYLEGKEGAVMANKKARRPIFETAEWTEEYIKEVMKEASVIAHEEGVPEGYPSRIEIVSAEQMIDAYVSAGLPISYPHWSFGKALVRNLEAYRRGYMPLAYELVINSNPCLAYCMEENTMAMQTLVVIHANIGHNSFFRNNHLFKELTDASTIIPYLEFARNYVRQCEELHGVEEVERVFDATHALSRYGIFHRGRKIRLIAENEEERRRRIRLEREKREKEYDPLYDSKLWSGKKASSPDAGEAEFLARQRRMGLPTENLLYFIEKASPNLETWQRELIRINRKLAQYFYPQVQTKFMNEGFATWTHYHITKIMEERGLLTEGAYLEILKSHTGVIRQLGVSEEGYSGFNPYALGLAMFNDIRRICENPTLEDREWFPDYAGNPNWREVIFKHAMVDFNDSSFFQQFLSPRLIREFRLFVVEDDAEEDHYVVLDIHNDEGYRRVRTALARQFERSNLVNDIQVVDVDLKGDRVLVLQHNVRDGRTLDKRERGETLRLIADNLWYPYEVRMVEVDENGEELCKASRKRDDGVADKD